MVLRKYIRYLFGAAFISFILNKFLIRPWILSFDEAGYLIIVVNSVPNFIEAVLGTILLAGIGWTLKARFSNRFNGLKDAHFYLIITLLAGVYVIAQEFKLHNLGGANVYDPFDVAASMAGLFFVNRILNKYGLVPQREDPST